MAEPAPPTLQLTVIEAVELKKVSYLGKLNPFVVAWIDPQIKKSTKNLHHSGKNPVWKHNLSFPLTPHSLQNPNSSLTIQVLSSSPINTRVIGSVTLSLHQIKTMKETCPNTNGVVTLQLWRPSGRAQGFLRVLFEFSGDLGVFAHNSFDYLRNLDLGSVDGSFYGAPVEGIPVITSSQPPFVPVLPTAPPLPSENNIRKNFLIGLLSGAVAAVLVGSSMV